MTSRAVDWFNQAKRDLEQANDSQKAGRHEWACFAAHHQWPPQGSPFEHYGQLQSQEVITYASEIINFVNSKMAKR